MKETRKIKVSTCIFLVLMLGIMLVIFVFSHQPGPTSAATSGVVAGSVGLKPSGEIPADKVPVVAGLSLRKLAHVGIYAALGCSAALFYMSLLKRFSMRRVWFAALAALATGVLYAVSDEVHQYFIPYRFFTVQDIALDSLGVVISVALVVGIWATCWWRHDRKQLLNTSDVPTNSTELM